ncbi:hypothetical protein [Endozoicomonas sp. 4G]|uniref:hypothetical protein n=1 Tax=Endozoicomonas sp. 4G TaxID=2872754 RepID=UPI00207879C6|nr:hypothetical protein [Endozoicomonas sp. 4G]
MLLKKLLIVIFATAFSIYCSDGHGQENRTPQEQVCFGNSQLPRISFPTDDNLKIGLHSLGIETILLPLFPVRDALDSVVKAIAAEIQQKDEQQREIIATARMLSRFRSDNRPEEPEEEGIEEETNHSDISWVCFGDEILLRPLLKSNTRYCFFPATGVSPDPDVEARGCSRAASDDSAYSEDSGSEDSGSSDESSNNLSDEDDTNTETNAQCVNTTVDPFQALNEFSQYCATLRLKMMNQESISDSEMPIESTDKQTHLPADQRPKIHQCDHEGCHYHSDRASYLKKHKQTHLPADQRPKIHQCDHEECNYHSDRVSYLKRHKQTHLPADQRPKIHRCDHEGCNYRSDRAYYLKRHKLTHLPADQRPRMQQCDHEGCDYSTDRAYHLKKHKQTHLPPDQRAREHRCDHEGCNYSTNYTSDLKRHKHTHLPADQRLKVHQCDHEGCDYSSTQACHLKRHKQIHLPANRRLKVHQCDHCNYSTVYASDLKKHKQTCLPADQRPELHQCDHEGCDYSTDHKGHLNRHKQTHLPADQRLKRKAHDQLPSDKKRKKGNKR